MWPPRILVVVGSVLATLAIFGVWIERQALDTDEWVTTSEELLQDDDIQVALSDYLVDELYSSVDVEGELQAILPPQAQPLAGPLAGGLRQLATQAARRALDGPRVEAAWAEANRSAHETLVDVVEDDGDTTDVTLELKPLVEDLADRVGIGANVADEIPPDAGSLQILSEEQIDGAQTIAKAIRGLALILSVLALASFAAAIYLPRGRRQATILWSGVGLIVAGIAALAIRSIAGDAVVDALVKNESAMDAGNAVWSIGTSLEASIAITVIVYGVLFAFAAWLASDTASARAVRRWLAPTLRERPGTVYGLLVVAALVYFALAPTHGVRALLTVAILTALGAFGIDALRRQAAEEFPRER